MTFPSGVILLVFKISISKNWSLCVLTLLISDKTGNIELHFDEFPLVHLKWKLPLVPSSLFQNLSTSWLNLSHYHTWKSFIINQPSKFIIKSFKLFTSLSIWETYCQKLWWKQLKASITFCTLHSNTGNYKGIKIITFNVFCTSISLLKEFHYVSKAKLITYSAKNSSMIRLGG